MYSVSDLTNVDVVKLFGTTRLSNFIHYQLLFLKIVGADISQVRVQSIAVIKHGYIAQHILLGFVSRVGRFLERKGLLERDAENNNLALDTVDEGPMST
jgi:hypothetical protein